MTLAIENLRVHQDSFISAQVVGDPAEIKLDGWKKFRPIADLSWYPPNLVVGTTDKPLAPGDRTLTVRNAAESAEETFTIAGEPEPEPPKDEWRTIIDLSRIANWKNRLVSAPGASITEGPFEGRHAIRIQKPNPGQRCELHHMDDRLCEGAVLRYSWWIWVPDVVNLTTDEDWTIMQQHGDNQAGYGGGYKIAHPGNRVIVSIKGGERLSAKGAQRYEYELNGKGEGRVEGPDEFGSIQRDRWHFLSYEVKWSSEWDGYVRCQLDDNPPLVHENVPNFSKISDSEMFRLGWYSGSGDHGALDMYVANAKIEVP